LEAPRWAPLRWVARVVLSLVIIAWSLLLIAWLTLHWGILPHIQQWREPIEKRASAALGVPVRIGNIEVRSSGWVPSFELREVVLLDAQNNPALRLPRVFAAISPRSLLSLELRFEQLLIDGAQLEVRRDKSGRIFVAGLDVGGTNTGKNDNDATDWFFSQHEFVVRGGSLRWIDEQRDAAPLEFTDLQMVVRNGLREHDIRLDATPPAQWGDRFNATGTFTQPLLSRRGDWERWSGSAYVRLPRADLHELRQHVTLPFELSEGIGALRGWLEFKDGKPLGATVDVALRAVTLRLHPTVDPISVEEVEARVIGQRTDDGVSLTVQHLTFLNGDDVRWPQGDMKFTWRQQEGQPATGGEFTAQRLDVGQMAQIATRIPLGESLRTLLAEVNPKGLVTDLIARWDGPVGAPTRYRAKATLSGLSLSSRASESPGGVGRPGLRGATMQLDATEAGGQARITMNGGTLDLPGVFDDPILVLDQLSAQLLWKIEPSKAADTPSKMTVQVRDARFSNADAQGELTAQWTTGAASGAGTGAGTGVGNVTRGGRYPGRLELDGKLSNGVATQTHRYLPLGLPKDIRQYVEYAVQGGKIVSAGFRVKGDLSDFPFYNARTAKDGEFRITAKIDDASYQFIPTTPTYASPWPVLTKASVDLSLDRNNLQLSNGKAQLGNVQWTKVQTAIRNLDTEPVLSLDGAARGPLSEMLQFINATPVSGWIGKALESSTGSGMADLKLNLALPLKHIDTGSTVKGSVALAGNDVRITPDSPLLAGAKGSVEFSNKGFAVVGASAKLYGGDATFDGGLQPDGAVRFNGQGIVSADGLRRATELGQVSRVAASLSGQTNYRASLGFVHGQSELTITSNLVGMAMSLPAPLNKAGETPLALRYQIGVDPSSTAAGQTLRDTLRFELGNLVQAQFVRDISNSQPRILRGGIGVLDSAPQPASGIAANVNLKTLNTDEWEAAGDKILGTADPRETREAREARESSREANTSSATDSGYMPDTIALRVQELTFGQRRLTHVSAGLSQDSGVWRANLDADQLSGYMEYRPPSRRAGAAAGRVFARLSRLSLPKSDVEQVESLLDLQPTSLPALDVVVDDLDLRGKKLGRVEVEATNRSTGQGRDAIRDWQLSKFNITMPEAQLVATGQWTAAGPLAPRATPVPRRMSMDFKLQIADSGKLLDRLGTSKAIRGGKGQMSGQVAWAGSPFALDYPSMSGQFNIAIDSGQFLKVEPGAARLLGVLSLQSLPRRLSLDFRDLFQEGFAFDNITGDVKIAQGVAQTNNLRMRGVQALVLMEGSADIEHESQDLRVVVVPEINAGTAALAYAVINPAIGLGAFLAQALLKKPLTQAGTREFHVSGPWADPKVEKVDRKFGDAIPTGEASAASAPQKN
jgi:uncharacterized protein (TIGR02099 family)